MKTKLRCWLDEHEGQGWSDALPDIALAMNRQSHTTLGLDTMPYEVFFGRKPRWEDRIGLQQAPEATEVEDEVLDDLNELAVQAQAAEDNSDDFYPDLSETNIFDENPMQQVY